jgi:hypothetical protein
MSDNPSFVVFLLFVLLVGGAVAADRIWRRRTIARLKRSHRRVVAKVKSITPVPMVPFVPGRGWRGQRLWMIEATWFDPKANMFYDFKSGRLDYDDAMRYTVGDPITVLIEPDNPNRYHMEIAR